MLPLMMSPTPNSISSAWVMSDREVTNMQRSATTSAAAPKSRIATPTVATGSSAAVRLPRTIAPEDLSSKLSGAAPAAATEVAPFSVMRATPRALPAKRVVREAVQLHGELAEIVEVRFPFLESWSHSPSRR